MPFHGRREWGIEIPADLTKITADKISRTFEEYQEGVKMREAFICMILGFFI